MGNFAEGAARAEGKGSRRGRKIETCNQLGSTIDIAMIEMAESLMSKEKATFKGIGLLVINGLNGRSRGNRRWSDWSRDRWADGDGWECNRRRVDQEVVGIQSRQRIGDLCTIDEHGDRRSGSGRKGSQEVKAVALDDGELCGACSHGGDGVGETWFRKRVASIQLMSQSILTQDDRELGLGGHIRSQAGNN